ncbi:MAG: HD domain-containing protein [Sulfolobales archaeon]|nr:HD domain-containing protein [Sulfolobales archaeon]MCX8198696.1 HD domain-containing protein [Sulfolobales archaeon]MDW8169769.1 HD domain-containing protein [Desulfurococcaceae archaeon]
MSLFRKVASTDPRLAEVLAIAELIMGDDPAHGWPHVIRVSKYAEAIVIGEELHDINWLVLCIAIVLHDIGRAKEKALGKHHSLISAEMAKNMLTRMGFNRGFIDCIKKTILAHSYSLRVESEIVESRILSDADKLDAVGAIGIARVLYTSCSMHRGFRESIEHFRQKIIKLPDYMYFKSSKRIALKLVKEVNTFIQWFEEQSSLIENEYQA